MFYHDFCLGNDNPNPITIKEIRIDIIINQTNIIALKKEIPAAPARICKNCASASCVDFRHEYCQYKDAV